MKLAPLPPNRRRRRWIIASVLLFMVSITTWWYWPRGDARFVGTWSRVTMGTKWADRLLSFRFQRNGGGYLQSRLGWSEYLTWWMEDEGRTLCFKPGLRKGVEGLEDAISRLSHSRKDPVVRFSVVDKTLDRLRYIPLGPPDLVEPNALHDFVLERRPDEISTQATVKLSNLYVPANNEPGWSIGELSVANCDFGPTVAYSLADGGTHNHDFEITGNQLRTRSRFEFVDDELPSAPPEINRRWIAIRASDQRGRSFVTVLSVHIREPMSKRAG